MWIWQVVVRPMFHESWEQVSVLWLDLFKGLYFLFDTSHTNYSPNITTKLVPLLNTAVYLDSLGSYVPRSTPSFAFGKGYQTFTGALFFAVSSAKNKFIDNKKLIDNKRIMFCITTKRCI